MASHSGAGAQPERRLDGVQARWEGRWRGTSLPTFWMQPSCDDTSASVSICCKTIGKGLLVSNRAQSSNYSGLYTCRQSKQALK